MNYKELFIEHVSGNGVVKFFSASLFYYLEARQDYDGEFKFLRWNWAAFLGSFYWMVYRRLYKEALVVVGIKLLFAILAPRIAFFLTILLHILLGMFGTTLYIQSIEKRIQNHQKPLGVDSSFSFALFFIVEAMVLFFYVLGVFG
jgi:hypothetical protein